RIGLHYHAMTEAVYVIEGQQRDEKGCYPTGSLYFNPPGSGHAISESRGFFLLAYAAPPDFANTERIRSYRPVQFNAAILRDELSHPFEAVRAGVKIYCVPLQSGGGMGGQLIKSASPEHYHYTGHCLLVLEGICRINGTTFRAGMLAVAASTESQTYAISAGDDSACLLLGLAFDT
ncbi:MAG: cupin domain-containing protein, partial [Cyanobacteria bacterium P01_A01_bin.135]